MSIKTRVFAAAAALAIAVPLAGMATTWTASAATPSCGPSCIDVFNVEIGHHFVLDVWRQSDALNQPVILFRASNTDPAEDWSYAYEAPVSAFITAGLIAPSMGIQYGSDLAFELEYSPYGAESGMCLGTAVTAVNGSKVSLQPCGTTARSVWIIDQNPNDVPAGNNFVAINGSQTAFSHPEVLTYPGNGFPTDVPRPQLFTTTLERFSQAPHQVYDIQRWFATQGVLP